MASSGPAARIGRILTAGWQPKNERQVWLGAFAFGLFMGLVFGGATALFGPSSQALGRGLIFGGVWVIFAGLNSRHRLHKRQDAQRQ